jgi:squalene-associated FAD-dependent desaturase
MHAGSESSPTSPHRRVVIVGGGLAGIAAAVGLSGHGLAGHGLQVTLLEAKQSLGGRAGSYRDAESGEALDHCQHVAMGCCTNFLDLCERTGCSDLLVRHSKLFFFGQDGQRSDFAPTTWLPAPLHLLPAMLGLNYLGWRDKLGIVRAMLSLMRLSPTKLMAQRDKEPTVATWLAAQRQTPAAIERFWKVVLVSALGESLELASLSAARKVFVDGFLAHRQAADVIIPRVSLAELYDTRIARWLATQGVEIRLGASVKSVARLADTSESNLMSVSTSAESLTAHSVIVAVPWRRLGELVTPTLAASVPEMATLDQVHSSPITSIHLWTDRPITDLPHAVLVDRLSQWVFARQDSSAKTPPHYYQVVISASRDLAGRSREAVIDEVWSDLQAIFPAARAARVEQAQMITQREAVFSVRPGFDALRPWQTTGCPRLFLAGDWTATGWPSTMEGAVRSGYLAAEQVLKTLGQAAIDRTLKPDLPRNPLVRLLVRSR